MGPKEFKDMMDYLTRPRMADGGRIGFKNRGAVVSEDMRVKSAEAIKSKASKKLKDFVETFKLENEGQLPTQKQIMDSVGGKSATVQKYLKEGVDYAPRLSKIEAGRLAGIKSGEVRAVPEGQEPSYVKRAKKIDEAKKFLSKQDAADFKKINDGKKAINNYFKSKPELINTTDFGKNIKQLLALRLDKDTGNIFSKVRSDNYYEDLAKKGKLFDIFDIKPVKEGGRNLRFPTNVNITPGQFNSVFIQNQVGKFFEKGINEDAVKNVENLLKEKNIRVKLPNVGYIGQDNPVAVDRAKGTFPKITDTLKKMDAPEEILNLFKSKGVKLNAASIPVITDILKMAESIPGDLAKKSYFKVAGKAAGLAFTPLILYDTYKALEQGKPLLESLEQGLIGTDLIGGTKRIVSLTPEERTARSVVKQDALKDLNLDMPMGFGFIEGPTPDSNLTLEEAQAKLAAGVDRVKQLEAQKNFDRATKRANFFGNLKDKAVGIGPDYQLELAGGGIAKLAGVDSGPPPQSGPNSQGLQGLMKRVKRI